MLESFRNEELAKTAQDHRQVEDRVHVNQSFSSPLEEDWHGESSASNQNVLLTSLNMQREHKLNKSEQSLIRWKSSEKAWK